ncbi:MFS transporter (plasmid) [Haloferax mediterranei ATCC 33500]|uniref:Transporter n=1 Tax=Haloferax mediterranei (strain ATCC 33500 / DSM 1411 / JCM 8866 / NBRC 14739 / NCIMB 2177 / R-4) TaxID=523841 RepID=I3RB05_HALMT|nr:MFS transporter [Haloferax mediterranei]AFK21415.1 transporter [Haloferax mediterranei ATCC 33500]AHZ24515.1 MFS transporter [Haloferax mediterranei ATCC 33500]ELZ97267.1 transporter [Haloferax mediterranei ATCC 33500]MDX5990432.1 MFS transporter [Haloferax mediterranei ATCC 33500]QCQ76911.1 MFS transporter [Haloferax mediterranei ATCC 33500]
METRQDAVDTFDSFRQFIGLERDVFVLSLAMFAFSLSFQMTGRYIPEYLRVLGSGATVVGLYGSVGNLIGALYPYPGGALSDRLGSRLSLTLFGTLSSAGFLLWFVAPEVPPVTLAGVSLDPWIWIFVGLFLTQAWKSFGLGATFAIVKQSVPPERLAMGFASTEIFRRIGFLLGPLIAAALLAVTANFVDGFQYVLVVAAAFGIVATIAQHFLYDADEDSIGKSFEGFAQLRDDLQSLPETLRPLLIADTLIRFANGMVYVFFVIVVTDFLKVGFTGFGVSLRPDAFFGILLGVEMVVALLTKLPVSKLAERTGLKPVVGLGFSVYAIFPVLLIFAPRNQWVLVALFAFSGLRFAGLPAHKALIVGPAERNAGGRVTGAYYLIRNTVVIPSAALGGWLYANDPTVAFSVASLVGIAGVGYFALRGKEFEAYASGA